MAVSKAFILCLLVSLLVIQLMVNAEGYNNNGGGNINIDCGSECKRRCSKASRTKMCLRACGSCCARCHCVPSGTSGHTAECPCYASITTHNNKLKCP